MVTEDQAVSNLLNFAVEMASLHGSASGRMGLEGDGQEDLELGAAHSWCCL